jgi:benzoyl-CoA reductase/2-hydroxyglutaryl-CoA dehydratase subunit BcrC/BadD/HgdB
LLIFGEQKMDEIGEGINRSKERGRRVIGCFPLYPPLELLHSMGLTPLVLWGLRRHLPKIERSLNHLQSYACSVVQYLTELVLSKEGRLLDGIFMYNACDSLRNLPEILACGLSQEGTKLPFLHIHIPMVPSAQTNSRAYLRNEIHLLIGELEKTFQVSFSMAKFRESVELYRQMRELSKALESLAREGKISFARFSLILEEASFYPPEEQLQILTRVQQEFESIPSPPNPEKLKKTVLSKIVANDIASLSRSYGYTPGQFDDAGSYYYDFYLNHPPCPTLLHSTDKRTDHILRLVTDHRAGSVIFIGEKFCEYEFFEFPYVMRFLKDRDIDSLLLEISLAEAKNIAGQRSRIEAFAEMVQPS